MAAGPTLVSAVPYSTTTLRVTWSGAVKRVDPGATNDALKPGNYTIAATTVPAMPVTVTGVAVVTVGTTDVPQCVDLTLDYETTPNAGYQLTALNVVGTIGTTYTDPTPGTPPASFTGYRSPQPARRLWDLWQMLPSRNRAEDVTRDLQYLIACFQDLQDLALDRLDRFPDIIDYELTPIRYLDAILYGLGNPFAFVLTDADKRRLAAVLVGIYKQKGTDVGIINGLRFFTGMEATIRCVARDDTWEIPVDRLGGTDAVGQPVTADAGTDKLTLGLDFPFVEPDPVTFNTTGTLPAPLVAGTTYYVRNVSGYAFRVGFAPAGGPGTLVNLTTVGTGDNRVADAGSLLAGWMLSADVGTDLVTLYAPCRFELDDPVQFTTSGTLPAPLAAGVTYYVRDVDVSLGTFRVAATAGGEAVDLTTTGTGTHRIYVTDPGTAMCGPGYDRHWLYGFEVLSNIALTDAQRQQALLIIDYMRPVFAYFVGLWEMGVKTWP